MIKAILSNQHCLRRARNNVGLQLLFAVLLFTTGFNSALASFAGRWQGTVSIPENTVDAIVDLDRDGSGNWIGSISMPQLNVSAAPLSDIAVTDSLVSFSIVNSLSDAIRGPAKFQAQFQEPNMITGDFMQAGNSARFTMQRTGAAQVALPPRSTLVGKELVGIWVGDYIGIGGYARHVTLTLSNQGKSAAIAEFIVVGKQTTNVPIDLVTYAESLLTLKSSSTGINFEGRYNPNRTEISGMFELGAFEFPLILQRRKEGSKP